MIVRVRAFGLACLVAAAGLAPTASHAATGRDMIRVSDGRQIAPVKSARAYWPSAMGTVELGGTAAERANSPSSQDSGAALGSLLALQAVEGPIGIESVIGPDNRKRVNPTTGFPARATVLVTFSAGRCTGWLIGADTVITAGHCVHPGGGGSFYPVRSYRVYPGRNGSASPYGSCTARWTASVVGWTADASDQHDYGAIKLNCSIGTTTGWYGYFWTSASLTGLPTIVSGYPGDKPLTQWRSDDLVRVTQTKRVFYQNDTVGGVSGAPVYYNRAGCGYCAMAIHAYGTYGAPPFRTNNHGTRVTRAVFDNLNAWRVAR
jgi:glutamyl endopeptidase